MNDDKTISIDKAKTIITKMFCAHVFFERLNYTKSQVVNEIRMIDDELDLDINPEAIIRNMISMGLIHQTGMLRGDPIYSKHKTAEIRTYR